MGASSVSRWVKHFKDGNTSIEDEPRSDRPRTASTERNTERVDEIIQDDRRMTVEKIAQKLGIGHSAIQEMIESLGYRKVCVRWVPRLFAEDHKSQRKAITSELLQRYQHEGDDFLLCIVTRDESWFHHFEPETKQQSMYGMPPFAFSIKKEGKDSAISCEGDGHSLLGCRGVYSGWVPGTWANHQCCSLCPDAAKLRHALLDKRPGRNIIILCDTACPHAARYTLDAIANMG
ncbi:hypothetical protein B7P43_G06790 [Cryptotermes secundus]|uniref:Mos1 transposase HTH domain-containing protein n=1 Tax=Cryptotermes secundus TaxID=105785 RepID=A0A2J7PD89_9NEOP|nr:hypothetical protein B7P43_G06790 [Cryptotermes secundus]